MHKHFADWYREAAIETNADQLEKRWKAIAAFVKPSKGRMQKATELIRIFHALPTTDPEFDNRFREAFQSVDKAFPMRENDYELRVLAGATLVDMISEGTSRDRNSTALASLGSWCQGLRGDLPISDLPTIADAHLLQEALKLRTASSPPEIKLFKTDIDEKLTAIQNSLEQNQLPAMAEPLSETLAELSAALNSFGASSDAALRWLVRNLKLQQEEINILWWLYSESSKDLDEPFSELKGPFASLVAGAEIADLVLIIPGPMAVRSFIRRTLKNINSELPEKASIREAVIQAPKSWTTNLVEKSARELEDLMPIHYAIRAFDESDGAKGSIKAVQKRVHAQMNTEIPLESLGLQMFYERLFLRISGHGG